MQGKDKEEANMQSLNSSRDDGRKFGSPLEASGSALACQPEQKPNSNGRKRPLKFP